MSHDVESKVDLCTFGRIALIDQVAKLFGGLIVIQAGTQRFLKIFHVVDRLELRNAGENHHLEECDEQTAVVAQNGVECHTQIAEFDIVLWTLLTSHRVHEFRGQYKGGALAFVNAKGHDIAQEVCKVNVKQVALACHHDILLGESDCALF